MAGPVSRSVVAVGGHPEGLLARASRSSGSGRGERIYLADTDAIVPPGAIPCRFTCVSGSRRRGRSDLADRLAVRADQLAVVVVDVAGALEEAERDLHAGL